MFGFYVHTCRALRVHISEALEQRLTRAVQRRFAAASLPDGADEVDHAIDTAQERYFDKPTSPGRRALDGRLSAIVTDAVAAATERDRAGLVDLHERLLDVMRRFLRARSSLARSFPLEHLDDWSHERCISALLEGSDRSGISWQDKLRQFLRFIASDCGDAERVAYLDAVSEIKVGGIPVVDLDATRPRVVTLPNVQVAMGEGVDLQRHCRHVIHHGLDWNPSTIEQRTGRIDRLGCKAAGRSAVVADLPYIAGASDERQYHVMTERERWFRVVMGEDAVKSLITPDAELRAPLLDAVVEALSFNLAL